MIPDNLITYVLIIVAAVVAFLIYRNRKNIQQSIDNDMDDIKDLNYTDREIEMYLHKHRGTNSSDLITYMNNNHLPDKEAHAIQKILSERQAPPPPTNP